MSDKDDSFYAYAVIAHWVAGLCALMQGLIFSSWRLIVVGSTCWVFTGLLMIGAAKKDEG